MARRKTINAAVAVLVAMGYCSLLVCQDLETTNSVKRITLDDLFISVKTTQHYQYTRLSIILKTWFQLAQNQTWFFTDIHNRHHQKQTNNHMVNTKCASSHSIASLCCKMGFELDYYYKTDKKWFCHFDDDNYVNVPRLLAVLQEYDYEEDWYIGRKARNRPRVVKYMSRKFSFWYATGGAGICLSRSLMYKLQPVIGYGKFKKTCRLTELQDDINLGFIIHVIGENLTVIPEFHSHLEQLRQINTSLLKDQVSLSYSQNKTTNKWNVVIVPGFDTHYDPTRFLSLHCFLYRFFPICSKHPGFGKVQGVQRKHAKGANRRKPVSRYHNARNSRRQVLVVHTR